MENSSSTAAIQKQLIGVVIFDFFPGGLTGLKWASDYMKLPRNHELCIILVKLKDAEPGTGEPLVREDLEEKFRYEIENGGHDNWKEWFDAVQEYVKGIVQNEDGDFVQARICTGRTVQGTLQHAIGIITQQYGLHTLVLGWTRGADGGSQMTKPENDLMTTLSGIKNIILAEIVPVATTTQQPEPTNLPTAPQQQTPAQSTEGAGPEVPAMDNDNQGT